MFSQDELHTIHVIAHQFAQHQGSKDPRIREVAKRCRVVERLCESVRKGARDSALYQAMRSMEKKMKEAVDIYKMKDNESAPPGWG